MSAPKPDYPAPHGYEYIAEEDADWKLVVGADEPGRRCRYMTGRTQCGAPAVAALHRGPNASGSWWAYCADHMYGRWIDDGVVLQWVLRPTGAVEAENARGWVRSLEHPSA
jgi:hypothetical protein